jgi:glycosyltransferase involved in cell wall biosynthesis
VPDGLVRSSNRILVTTDAVGGVWRYSVELAAGLAERDIGVILASMGPPANPAQRTEAEAIPGVAFVETGLPLDWTAPDPASLAASTAALHALAARFGARSVHLHAPALVGNAPWPIPVVAVAHSCVATWWRAVRGGALPPDLTWRAAATGEGLCRANVAVAPSRAFAAALRAEYGVERIRVIHNGRRSVPDAAPAARAVLAAGRLWDEGKGMAVLDQAAAGLGAPVRAAGGVQGPGGTVGFANLDLLGTLDEAGMARARSTATVFAAPARYEPFGLAVLEAAQAGQALVLSDIPTFRELWDGAALFASDGGLAAALRRALDDPAPLAATARERAGRYTAASMAARTSVLHALTWLA